MPEITDTKSALAALKQWVDTAPPDRRATITIRSGSITCELIDLNAHRHNGAGHTYAGMGKGYRVKDAIASAFDTAERWSKLT